MIARPIRFGKAQRSMLQEESKRVLPRSEGKSRTEEELARGAACDHQLRRAIEIRTTVAVFFSYERGIRGTERGLPTMLLAKSSSRQGSKHPGEKEGEKIGE